jgi:serine/threonine-protein kinase
MMLARGARLGPYEILAPLGAGGMGEVYRARDTRLGRDVALKILPEAFATDPDRLARFQREAQVLASLNHPNIAAIHGLEESNGVRALVLELVEGHTLADRIARGPIPVDESLLIAKQIAEALEAAHELGIIHRDLKPANIKLRADGTVKVLDFGLAKALEPSQAARDPSQSPTITSPAMTQMGVILGTAAYMSPEQARGQAADKRSDIWAIGCVLYEMLTGRRAFDGEDTSDTIASVLKTEPDWSSMPAEAAVPVVAMVKACLVKDRRHRLSDMSTPKFVLSELSASGGRQPAPMSPASSRLRRLAVPIAVAAAAAIVGAAAGVWMLRSTPRPPSVTRFSFDPEGNLTGVTQNVLAISPDGTRLVYNANGRLYGRALDELESRPLTGTEFLALNPIFAPDGNSIAFMTSGDRRFTLRRIPFSGGSITTIAALDEITNFSGLSWGPEGILVGLSAGGGILRVSPDGGSVERIITAGPGELMHRPQMLPDRRTVLFTLANDVGGDDRWDRAQIVAQSLVDGTRHTLIEGGSDAWYVQTGHLLYAARGIMYAAPFDVETLTVTSARVPVVSGVRGATGGITGAVHLAVSDTGTLAYIPGAPVAFTGARNLVIGDGRGSHIQLKVPAAAYSHPRVSPNGRFLAVSLAEGGSSDIFTYDLSGTSELQRLTFGGQGRHPVWSADSRRVTFQSARDRAIWWQGVDGGNPERLTTPLEGQEHFPESWSADGARLLFSVREGPWQTLWVLTREGLKTEPFGQVQSAESLSASFSPDGRWVVYASTDRAGGALSPNRGVFVEPFPSRGVKRQAPKRLLDYHPVWARDGKSIVYVPGANRPLVSVPITTAPSIVFGTPVEMPRAPLPGVLSLDLRGYDLLPDGRILSLSSVSDTRLARGSEIRVVLNWQEELKRLAPTN